ncbi:hypothetical protein VUR80DRAFT_7966 [Thermomyces stellatus]
MCVGRHCIALAFGGSQKRLRRSLRDYRPASPTSPLLQRKSPSTSGRLAFHWSIRTSESSCPTSWVVSHDAILDLFVTSIHT